MRKQRQCGAARLASLLLLLLLLILAVRDAAAAAASDTAVLQSFLKALKNGEVLGWGSGSDPCSWKHIRCQGDSVVQIGVESMGLTGTLTPELNKLTSLEYLGVQFNNLTGPLPALAGMSSLKTVYLNNNAFTTIPPDFFRGLDSLETIYLDNNLLNGTQGWKLPDELKNSQKLVNLSLTQTSLTGAIPDYIGALPTLKVLNLAYNRLTGGVPASFANSGITQLELNNMAAPGMSGTIDALGSMESLSLVWLQGNAFSGAVPDGLAQVVTLRELKLNDNSFVGTLPNFTMTSLQVLSVDNNKLMGPIPDLTNVKFTFSNNQFCQPRAGQLCAPQVNALLTFIAAAGYPSSVISSWSGNNPCVDWLGVVCDSGGAVVVTINLPASGLVGTISPAIGELQALHYLTLSNNNLSGPLPTVLGAMPSLDHLDLSNNDLSGPMIVWKRKPKLLNLDGNPRLLNGEAASPAPLSLPAPAVPASPSGNVPASPSGNVPASPSGNIPASPSGNVPAPDQRRNRPEPSPSEQQQQQQPKKRKMVAVGVVVAALSALAAALCLVLLCCRLKRRENKMKQQLISRPRSPLSSTMPVYPRSSTSDPELGKTNRSPSEGSSHNVRLMEAGNLVISIQVLRQATRDFSSDTVLGRGGFGVVYKGVLDDGTAIAVKRMEASSAVVSSKGLSEFQAEIGVLSKVRHRHLVALLGYCTDGMERLLVYEYLPNGTLHQHLFEHRERGKPALGWKRRLAIALDVARGMEYLHTLAHRSFIHRDLKPSNILLDDDFRAKVSDFGLVKLAPEGKYSVETRLAGTFGYLAPEYAVTGRVTTKADVFSFGVVLMELITGRRALDETQGEENMHLVSWFRRQGRGADSLRRIADPELLLLQSDAKGSAAEEEDEEDEVEASMRTVAELARHCTAREPQQRPDMGHVVNVLSPLVGQWRQPADGSGDGEEVQGIDLSLSLPQALKRWQQQQALSGDDAAAAAAEASDDSLPPRPAGFADSFGSADAR